MPHRIFREVPAFNPHLMQQTPKNRNEKTALPLLSTCCSPSGEQSAIQKMLNAAFSRSDSCRIQPNGLRIGDFAKQPYRFFANERYFGQPVPSPGQDSPTENWFACATRPARLMSAFVPVDTSAQYGDGGRILPSALSLVWQHYHRRVKKIKHPNTK